ncbi:MAG TPA: hypothetical protein VEH27_00740 [Methylomirabilota bacterium]|nr:hypothetical protein [Methylomirabilota bacterium]
MKQLYSDHIHEGVGFSTDGENAYLNGEKPLFMWPEAVRKSQTLEATTSHHIEWQAGREWNRRLVMFYRQRVSQDPRLSTLESENAALKQRVQELESACAAMLSAEERGNGYDRFLALSKMATLLNRPAESPWKREVPTRAGFYWFVEDRAGAQPELIQVKEFGSRLQPHLSCYNLEGRWGGYSPQSLLQEHPGLFAGPIEPPAI